MIEIMIVGPTFDTLTFVIDGGWFMPSIITNVINVDLLDKISLLSAMLY